MKSFPGGADSFRVLVEASPDPILTAGPSGRVVYANPAAERFFGHPPGELTGVPFTRLLRAPPRDRSAAALLRLLSRAGLPPQGTELTACTREGREVRVEVSVTAHEHQGRRHLTAYLRDVSRRAQAERRLRTEHAVTRALFAARSWEEAVPRVLRVLGEGLGCRVALFWAMEPDAPILCHGGEWSAPGAEVERLLGMSRRLAFLEGLGLPGRVWAAGAPLWVPDLRRDPAFTRAAAAEEGGVREAYLFPVRMGSETFGVVELFWREAVEYDRELREMLAAVAGAMGQLVQRERSEAAVAASEERFRSLIEYASDVITVLDARGRIRYESPAVERVLGYTPEELLGRDVFDLIHPDDAPRVREALALGIRTPGVALSLEYRFLHRNGEWCTLESVGRSLLHTPAVRGIVVNSRDVSLRRRGEDEARRLSLTDELTGLLNRRGLFALAEPLLEEARESGREMLLLYVDVDRLKQVNDRFGHAEGDRVLIGAATLLTAAFRDTDVVARVGGDEFVVLAPDLPRALAEATAARLGARVREWNAARAGRAPLSLSLGLAWADPQRTASVEEMLEEADAAMYAEKRRR